MNQDFTLAQLRVAAVAIIAYLSGRGIFTPADATLATALVTSLGPILAPWLLSVMATWGTKKVPQGSVAVRPVVVNAEHPMGSTVNVTGKVVGALIVAMLIVGAAPNAQAQTSVSPLVPGTACDIDALFRGMNPKNFMARAKACGLDDVTNAIALAGNDLLDADHTALACLVPLQTIQKAVQTGGILTLTVAFRKANRSGFPQTCVDFAKDTARKLIIVP